MNVENENRNVRSEWFIPDKIMLEAQSGIRLVKKENQCRNVRSETLTGTLREGRGPWPVFAAVCVDALLPTASSEIVVGLVRKGKAQKNGGDESEGEVLRGHS